MEDKQELSIEKYGFKVKNRYRDRGAVVLDTNQGLCLMREYEKIKGHFDFENKVKERLCQEGMSLTDRVIPNLEGELVTELDSGEKYVVYRWYQGDSCDYRNERDLALAAGNLGRLHRCLREVPEEPTTMEESLAERYERQNRELKRVYQFMKGKKRKSDFELDAMSCFSGFYEKAEKAREQLAKSPYLSRYRQGSREICHGAYNYHNIIFSKKGIATISFESAGYGIQLMDLAYFLRKVLEKNRWQTEKGRAVLEGYAGEMPLGEEEMSFLGTVLSYPVKYRKLMNQYINGKKSWISDKSMEKLGAVREMESEKEKFLRNIPTI